jgi:hypothetical protein
MSLARFTAANASQTSPAPQERCELCGRPLVTDHGHVADVPNHRIVCACRPCYLLFTASGAAQGRYRAIPSRCARLSGLELGAAQWDALQIPIDLAFFFYSTPAAKVVAFYPSPAGATESLLPLEAWHGLVERFPLLGEMEPDVEALLVSRTRDKTQRCYIVPIDVCYELVGLIRTTWKGFDGGNEAHQRMEEFFAAIEGRCTSPTPSQAIG